MKKLIYSIIYLVIVLCFCSCEKMNNDKEHDQEGTNLIEVKLCLCGDVEIEDEELTKAWGASNSVYGIKINVLNENTKNYESYAYGIFSSVNNLTIKLNPSKKYDFEATYMKDFTDKYSYLDDQYKKFTTTTDEFVYGSNYFYPTLWGELSSNHNTSMVESDFYYGKLTNYTPSETCSIYLDRKTFGLSIDVKGLSQGSIEYKLSNYPGANYVYQGAFNYPTTEISKKLGFIDFAINDSEDWYLEINYIDNNNNKTGILQELLTFYKCKGKKIHITLSPNISEEIQNKVSITLANDDIDYDNLDYSFTI